MAQVESKVDISALQERVNSVYDVWALAHADEKVLTFREYDRNEHYQKVESARIEPELDLELARSLGKIAMGETAYAKLSSGYEENHVLEIAVDRHRRGQSTLIPTLHLRNVLDTAMTHNNLFVTSGGNQEIAEINDVITNPMMSRLTIDGRSVVRVLVASGRADMALPSGAAMEYGMSKEDTRVLERLYGPALKNRLGEGIVIHWSLPGTRGKRIITKAGDVAMSVSRINDGIANIVRKRIGLAVPVPMDVRFGDCKVEVLKPRVIDKIEDVHTMMEEMVEAASELSGEQIYYGLPEGAQMAEF